MIFQLIFSLHLPKRIACVFSAVCEISLIINSSSSSLLSKQEHLSLEVTPHRWYSLKRWGQTCAQLLSVGSPLQQGGVCHCKCCVRQTLGCRNKHVLIPTRLLLVLLLSMPILGSPVLSSKPLPPAPSLLLSPQLPAFPAGDLKHKLMFL